MADLRLVAKSALGSLAGPGRHGAPVEPPGVRLSEVEDVAFATVMARRGRAAELAMRAREVFGVELATTPSRATADGLAFVLVGPGHWLVLAQGEDGPALAARLGEAFAGLASITEQSGGRVLIRLRGEKAPAILQKGALVDLDPRAFPVGASAVTVIGRIGVHFWLADEGPTFDIVVGRSYAAAFWRWLVQAGAEYGVAVEVEP